MSVPTHPSPSALGSDRAEYPSDEAAMAAIRAGHSDLLGTLYRRHSRRVFAQCLRMVSDAAAADDLVQEAFLRVLRYRSTYRGDARFSTWLYRIVSNVCLDYLKARSKQSAVVADAAAHEAVVQDSAIAGERVDVLRTALDRMPPEKRELLIMCRVEGLAYAQIAERLGAREGTIRVRVHRAMIELKDIFDGLWEETP